MLLHREPIKEHIVLRTHAQVLADFIHLCADVMPVDGGRTRGRWEQSGEDRPGQEGKSPPYLLQAAHPATHWVLLAHFLAAEQVLL